MYNGEDIKNFQEERKNNILKSFGISSEENDIEKAHNVGDIHPNGKWVWTELPSGKFDWRTIGGRASKRSGQSSASSSKQNKTSDVPKKKVSSEKELTGAKLAKEYEKFKENLNQEYDENEFIWVFKKPYNEDYETDYSYKPTEGSDPSKQDWDNVLDSFEDEKELKKYLKDNGYDKREVYLIYESSLTDSEGEYIEHAYGLSKKTAKENLMSICVNNHYPNKYKK